MKKIFIAGHNGMVGSAILRKLNCLNRDFLLTRERSELDLLNQSAVNDFLLKERPDIVYMAGAKVGGILANSKYPAKFIYENLTVQSNLIHASYLAGVERLLFLGSSCIYPNNIENPIKEEDLMTGKLEWTNEPYAIAKIAGIKTCSSYNREYGLDYRSIMPTNLYGLNDNYDPADSHVIPALIQRIHYAKKANAESVTIWGSGKPRREFLFADDLADAAIFIMGLEKNIFDESTKFTNGYLNVGYGSDITIEELTYKVIKTIGYKGKIIFDRSKPDGTKKKLLDSKRIKNLGWEPKTELDQGLHSTYKDFLSSINEK